MGALVEYPYKGDRLLYFSPQFPIILMHSLFPKSTISTCMLTSLAMTIILHGSHTVCDTFQLPNTMTHILQGSEKISCEV